MGNHLYSYNLISFLLLPFSAVYWILYKTHRLLYSTHILNRVRVEVPVIVVGNLTVGGTGKTPLVVWLAELLKHNGYHPGIISRGYGGKKSSTPRKVEPDSSPLETGDEALLLVNKTGQPVYIAANRAAAARALLDSHKCDVLISDDGLQHHRLQRDIEIVVIDGWRRFGNRFLLPAGPMRESIGRLSTVNYILCRGGEPAAGEIAYSIVAKEYRNLKSGETRSTDYFNGKKAHAIAAIGNPEQFFKLLEKNGVAVDRHIYPDHHQFSLKNLEFGDDLPVIMTEKDAVKCSRISGDNNWVLAIEPQLPEQFGLQILQHLNKEFPGG